jgi:hypothetical protein
LQNTAEAGVEGEIREDEDQGDNKTIKDSESVLFLDDNVSVDEVDTAGYTRQASTNQPGSPLIRTSQTREEFVISGQCSHIS